MRPVSESTQSLLRQLVDVRWRTLLDPDLVRRVGEIREVAAVPGLLGVVYGAADASARAAAALAIDRIVGLCGVLDLARLDGMCRGVAEWRAEARGTRAELADLARGLVGTLGVIGFHASGYVREAVVGALAESWGGRELPFLLIRLNDWVPQVREAARRAALARVGPGYVDYFVRCLPLVERLREQGRGDHGEVLDAVVNLLRSEQGRAALRRGISVRMDRQTRRLAFGLLADGPDEEAVAALWEGLAAEDTVMRLRAARELRRGLDGEALREALGRMARDRFMPVRREALYGHVERLPESAGGYLRGALLDPHASIREAARYFLDRRGERDVAPFYRERLAGATAWLGELPVVIAGLGETGGAADAAAVERFLDHPLPRARRAAGRAIGRLDPDGFGERMLGALGDESAGVSKAARDVVAGRVELMTPGRLWAVFESARWAHVRRNVLTLVAGLRWWDAAPLLVTATGAAEAEVRSRAAEFLARWAGDAGRLTVRPGRGQVEALERALAGHAGGLAQGTRAGLEWTLSYAKREMK